MISFYQTGFNNQKVHIIMEDGMQVGQLRRVYNTRYGQKAVISNLKKEIDDIKLTQIMHAVQATLGIQTFEADGKPKFVDSGISTVQIY